MRTLDQIGGMSWASTVPYVRLVNEGAKGFENQTTSGGVVF